MAEEKSHEHAEHHEHHHAEHKKPEGLSMKKSDVWKISTAITVLLLIISIATGGFGISKKSVANTVPADDAAEKAVDYINSYLLQPGTSATLKSVSEKDGVYSINISVGGRDYISYVTQDGKLLFVSGYDMTQEIEEPTTEEDTETTAPEAIKSDKPEVELFVMSHCPFGTQAEKGIIPAVKALGDKIDFKLRFVYYAMHGEKEVTEQTRQYCIQEEQNDKFLDYLGCFLKEGNSEECLTEAKIDTAKMDACIEAADEEFEITANLEDEEKWLSGRYPLFNTDAEKNEVYGVGGSPTLVINGAQASSSRDSASYLKAICDHFNEAPEECDEELSSTPPSSGFGYAEGVDTDAQC